MAVAPITPRRIDAASDQQQNKPKNIYLFHFSHHFLRLLIFFLPLIYFFHPAPLLTDVKLKRHPARPKTETCDFPFSYPWSPIFDVSPPSCHDFFTDWMFLWTVCEHWHFGTAAHLKHHLCISEPGFLVQLHRWCSVIDDVMLLPLIPVHTSSQHRFEEKNPSNMMVQISRRAG